MQRVMQQKVEGDEAIIGIMIESNLAAGNQQITADPTALRYGVSITDECYGLGDDRAAIARRPRQAR